MSMVLDLNEYGSLPDVGALLHFSRRVFRKKLLPPKAGGCNKGASVQKPL